MRWTAREVGAACAIGAAVTACSAGVAYFLARSRSAVRSFRSHGTLARGDGAEKTASDCTRDRFSERKVPNEVDVIVIGSGISGMYCAALLAKAGKRVLVLEQHTAAGGCTRCHEDKGWGFDTGLHSVGQIDKYGHLLDIVSDGPKVQWRKLGTEADGFTRDEIVIGDGSPYKYRAGKQTFLDDLIAAFPEEEQSLREYLKLVIECSEQSKSHFFGKLFPRWVERLIENTVGCRFQRLASLTVSQVLDHLFVSSALKALLSSQFGAYGLPPDQASFFAHAAVVSHYLEGAHYPIGGPQEISRALIPTIIAAGGRVLVNAPVKNILSSPSGAAIGVEIEDNLTRIFAPVVISAAGAFATESIMNRAPLLQPEMKSLLSGISHVYAFIGMEGSSQQLQLPSFNTWVIPGEDINSDCREYYEHPFASDKQLMFISFPSAKDPLYSKKYPKKSNCIIIAEALPEWFEDYPTCNTGDTPKTYDALKLHFKNKLLQGLYKLFPHLDGRIRYCEIATPLTNYKYLRRTASYGLSHPPFRYTAAAALRPRTNTPGLWLTGQDIATSGIAGAMTGALLTAHSVLGYGFFDIVVCRTNLISDIEKNMLQIEEKQEQNS